MFTRETSHVISVRPETLSHLNLFMLQIYYLSVPATPAMRTPLFVLQGRVSVKPCLNTLAGTQELVLQGKIAAKLCKNLPATRNALARTPESVLQGKAAAKRCKNLHAMRALALQGMVISQSLSNFVRAPSASLC